ncbi:DUF805 domain-containing protein [Gelatiniphilus marinus]|uniref:DUF805 domain-containing protein n=1 Tax=Gelatiniphilus marinus TaxID=1759464 RepID=A0ABW5JTZ1_9FLAO
MKYLITPFKKYFDISTKASIKEFWYFFLFYTFLISPMFGFLRGLYNINDNIALVIRIVLLIPFITIGFRRLNDAKINKWLFLIPFVNLILASSPSKPQ